MKTPTRISLAALALEQQEMISRQSQVIMRLLAEVSMFRDLTEAEEKYAAAYHAEENQ